MNRDNASRILTMLLGLAVAAIAGRAAAQAPTPPAPEAAPQAAVQDASPGAPLDAVSSFQVRIYKIRDKKLWKGLLQALQQAGYPPEEVDEKQMRVKTSFVDFKAIDYSEEVGDPPPRLSGSYHILQMNKVKEGKVSLEGAVARGDKGGAVLSLRARILVQGLDQAKRIRVLADRRSSGVIESDFMQVLEDTLHLERM
jgi:hypothetical protein